MGLGISPSVDQQNIMAKPRQALCGNGTRRAAAEDTNFNLHLASRCGVACHELIASKNSGRIADSRA